MPVTNSCMEYFHGYPGSSKDKIRSWCKTKVRIEGEVLTSIEFLTLLQKKNLIKEARTG